MANNALVKIQMKRASTSDWNRTTNTGSAWQGYLLRQAEFGIEVFPDNSVKIKIGDGNTIWKDLKYVAGETGYFVNSLPALSEAAVNTFYIVGEEIYYTSDNSNWKKIGGDAQNFDKLNNRPKYNSTLMTHNTNIPKVPTKASELAYTPASGSGIASTNVQGAINELANKMKNTITPSSQTNILYGTDSSANIAYYPFSDSKVNSSIAKRTNYGSLKVATPIEDDDATTKKYVDDKEVDLQNDIDTLGNTVSGINTRVGTLESTTSGLDSRLTTLNTTVTTMGNQVNTNKNDITLLKTKTDTLQAGVTQNANNISSLNTRVNQFDSRITQNANDIQDEMTTRFDNDIKDISITGASGNTILLTKNDDSTLATNIPMVSNTTNGLMTKEAYAAIQNNTQAIEDLKNMGGRYIGISFATKAQLDAYTIPSTVKVGDFTYVSKDETHDNATSLYVCAMNGANKEFRFAYVIEHEAIGTATTTTKGIVMGSTANGKIFVETDGTMSLNGYDNIINSLGNKVDKVTGKDLSTNDYTNADKTKVGILTSTGTGNMYLADDGTYKTIIIPDSGVQDVKVNGTSIVDSTGSADLHTIALSGSYNDLINKPQNLVQDANYVHTDNNFTDDLFARVSVIDRTGLGNKALMDDANYRALADVAFSGSYNDLTNLPTNLVQDASYVHTDNNFTTTLKTKLENIDPTGEENIIESISLNGSTLAVDSNKNVDIDISNYALEEDVPTKTSDLTNDSNFVVDASYIHTDNNFTTTLKDKLTVLDPNGEANVIEIVKVSGNPLVVQNKAVNIDLTAYRTSDQITDMITDAISGVTQFDYKIVTTLPETGVKGTIYLVPLSNPETPNLYEEYLYINNAWEIISTRITLKLNNLVDGSTAGSVRGINSAIEDSSYTMGQNAFAEGNTTTASGDNSHAEGFSTQALADNSHAEGEGAIATGPGSHAEGGGSTASGDYSHAEGDSTEAYGYSSHAEGKDTYAEGNRSHAEGDGTTASGSSSHAEGDGTTASAGSSHAEGANTTASGIASHAEGSSTIAKSSSQHVQGKYNIEDSNSKYAHIVGNGTADTSRSNAHTIDWNGNSWYKGDIYLNGTSQDNAPASIKYNSTDHCIEFLVS